MATKKRQFKDTDKLTSNIGPIKIVNLPYSTVEQNVTWYIKVNNKNITFGDLQALKPWLKTYNEFKEAAEAF